MAEAAGRPPARRPDPRDPMRPPDLPVLLRWTRFPSDPHGTGPEKRSAQIAALCRRAGFAVADMQPPVSVPRGRTLLAGLAARWRFGRRASLVARSIGLLGYQANFYREALARHEGRRLLLWETTYDRLLPAMARAAGFRVIALPHNLEALVSEAVFADAGYDPLPDLAAEVSRLSLADAIHVIAREEQWFLETQRQTSRYLPYFPVPELAAEYADLRRRREARARADGTVDGPLLLLGSAFNPATGRGMDLQLGWLAGASPAAGVVVAGPETDVRLAAHRAPGVSLLGRVPAARLHELFVECSALLIHTSGGAGAVTRIPEALLAGIPVIANENAARDRHDVPGVHVYASPEEFQALVKRPLPIPPGPTAPRAAEAALAADLLRLSNLTPD